MQVSYPLVVFNAELILVGCLMALITCWFIQISNQLFHSEYDDEKRYFLKTLLVFLGTYILRAIWLLLLLIYFDVYKRSWTKLPNLTFFIEISMHLCYDVFPIFMILRQHHRTFQHEESHQTQVIMSERFNSFRTTVSKPSSSSKHESASIKNTS